MPYNKKFISQTAHRNGLENLLRKHLPTLDGDILDIGSKNRRYDHLLSKKPTAIDISPNETSDVLPGDMNSLPFDDSSFDSIMAIEVFEYTSSPQKAISEIIRVLKNNGTFVMSVPFLYPYHDDYLRFTENYLRKILLKKFLKIEIIPIGNSLTIIADIVRSTIFREKNIILKCLLAPIYLLFLSFITLTKNRKNEKRKYVSGYFIIAKK